jgi:hypothetical protein
MRMPRLMRRQHVIRRRVFIGCEGDSEVSYIGLVRRIVDDVHRKVYLDAQPLQPGGGDPLDLVRRAEETITKIERNREPYDEKYLLIDRDLLDRSPERDQQMQAILDRIGTRIIWQDPAHEALILRHLPGCAMRRPATAQIAMQQLLQQWPEYEKPMSARQLANRINLEALRQAAEVENELRAFLVSIELFKHRRAPRA